MPLNKKYFTLSLLAVVALCVAQIIGSGILVLGCLAAFLVFVGWTCIKNYTLPILLFFLPWSQLLRQTPTSFSFFTFALVLVCFVSIIKKGFRFKRYHLVSGVALLILTLVSKLIDGSGLTFDYIAFIMLIMLFPIVKEEWRARRYDFYAVVTFFSVGIVSAALCAQWFATSYNIAQFIQVDSYLTITRLSGFYGDPNFYTAQITAALSGVLLMLLRQRQKGRVINQVVLMLFLVYCGFLSGSKSFVLVALALLVFWTVEVLRQRGRTGVKVALICGVTVFIGFIATSALFSGLLDIIATRFSSATDASGFTTGRTELWANYINELFSDAKVIFLGKGFTNVKLDGRASHNSLLQMVFQLGLVGSIFMISWIKGFFRDAFRSPRAESWSKNTLVILMVGTFLPWMAIDIMYFDEFFLLQWFVFLGVRELRTRPPQEMNQNRPDLPA